MNYLLDTCVLSDLVAKEPNPGLLEWIDGVEEATLYLCVVSIGEIHKGIQKLSASTRKRALIEWLERDLLMRFKGRTLIMDTEAMLTWGLLTADLEKRGRPMPVIDSLIAAIVLRNEFTLVTRNEADVAHSGVSVFSPWQ